MERKLKALFEYQRFEQNENLSKLIAETESRMAKALSDDELMMVAAAGDEVRRTKPEELRREEEDTGKTWMIPIP